MHEWCQYNAVVQKGELSQLKHGKVHNIFIKVSYSVSLSIDRPTDRLVNRETRRGVSRPIDIPFFSLSWLSRFPRNHFRLKES